MKVSGPNFYFLYLMFFLLGLDSCNSAAVQLGVQFWRVGCVLQLQNLELLHCTYLTLLLLAGTVVLLLIGPPATPPQTNLAKPCLVVIYFQI